MNLYEENLYDLYSSCFPTGLITTLKEKPMFERILLIVTLVLFGIMLISIGISPLKIVLFYKMFYFSFWSFLVSMFVLVVIILSNQKKNKIRDMKNKKEKLAIFSSKLEEYGYETDDQIESVLKTVKLNFSNRCKVKERKFDNFFKVFITFWVPAVIFISKEKWEQIKNQISQEYFNNYVEIAIIILGILAFFGIYVYIISRDLYGSKKEEKLAEALEEVLSYRNKIKLYTCE